MVRMLTYLSTWLTSLWRGNGMLHIWKPFHTDQTTVEGGGQSCSRRDWSAETNYLGTLGCYNAEVDCKVGWTVQTTAGKIPKEKGKFTTLISKHQAKEKSNSFRKLKTPRTEISKKTNPWPQNSAPSAWNWCWREVTVGSFQTSWALMGQLL